MCADSSRQLAPLLTAALTAVTERGYSPQEWGWINRIEQRRTDLAASTEVIEYLDFGAGSPDSTRTAEQMLTGVPSTQTVGDLTRVASKDAKWAGLLFRLVRHARPQRCVEMGSAAGVSGAYQAAALMLNGRGTLLMLEGGKAIAELAGDTIRQLGLDRVATVVQGRFHDTLAPALAERTPDYAFIDGHHDGDATRDYFQQITTVMSQGLVVLDDIDWSSGMQAAWQDVTRAEGVTAAIDLGRVGICVIGEATRQLRCSIADY